MLAIYPSFGENKNVNLDGPVPSEVFGGCGFAREGRQADGEGWAANGRHASLQAGLKKSPKGDLKMDTRAPAKGPKAGTPGFVDDQGRIWIRDRAHAKLPDHWDVQIDDGDDYIRVDSNGEEVLTS